MKKITLFLLSVIFLAACGGAAVVEEIVPTEVLDTPTHTPTATQTETPTPTATLTPTDSDSDSDTRGLLCLSAWILADFAPRIRVRGK